MLHDFKNNYVTKDQILVTLIMGSKNFCLSESLKSFNKACSMLFVRQRNIDIKQTLTYNKNSGSPHLHCPRLPLTSHFTFYAFTEMSLVERDLPAKHNCKNLMDFRDPQHL